MERYEEAKSHCERVEVLQVELEQKLLTKDKDMAGKDVEIAELNRRLRESNEALEVEKQKVESLEIDLDAEKLKSESAEEARKVANSVLNSIELDRAVAALTVGSRQDGHREIYIECTTHVETVLNVQRGTRHCSVK
ncbi:hypothetical protein Hdeb2414_s0014g00424291 [Helianthus debilis subsp. tardiflorus]